MIQTGVISSIFELAHMPRVKAKLVKQDNIGFDGTAASAPSMHEASAPIV